MKEISNQKIPEKIQPVLSRTGADLLRLVAMLAVLTIHATGRAEVIFLKEHRFISEEFFGVLLNQLARFCVPLFVLLSGFGLGRKYAAASGFGDGVGDFFRARFSKIGVPFFVWTIGILLLTKRFGWSTTADGSVDVVATLADNLRVLLPYLTVQGADYHFYFFIIILQMYLLFPLLFRAVRAAAPGTRTLVLGLLAAVQLLWTWPAGELLAMVGISMPHFFSAFLVYWVFYFYAGVFFALRARGPSVGSPRTLLLSGGIALIALCEMLREYLVRSYLDPEPGYYNHFSRWSVVVFAMAVFWLWMGLDARIAAFFAARPKLAERLSLVAGLTFAVYIYHTWFLRLIQATPIIGGELFLTTVSLIVVSFLVAYGLHRLVRWNWLRTPLGLP